MTEQDPLQLAKDLVGAVERIGVLYRQSYLLADDWDTLPTMAGATALVVLLYKLPMVPHSIGVTCNGDFACRWRFNAVEMRAYADPKGALELLWNKTKLSEYDFVRWLTEECRRADEDSE